MRAVLCIREHLAALLVSSHQRPTEQPCQGRHQGCPYSTKNIPGQARIYTPRSETAPLRATVYSVENYWTYKLLRGNHGYQLGLYFSSDLLYIIQYIYTHHYSTSMQIHRLNFFTPKNWDYSILPNFFSCKIYLPSHMFTRGASAFFQRNVGHHRPWDSPALFSWFHTHEHLNSCNFFYYK